MTPRDLPIMRETKADGATNPASGFAFGPDYRVPVL
jgi:hypothetical protein